MARDENGLGAAIHDFARELWPINRSLTGSGVRETLGAISKHIPGLTLHEVPSGTQVFDWTVPKEWVVRGAWIETPAGRRICDFGENNLHLVGYSTPVSARFGRDELLPYLHSIPEQPNAIPYVTSYYHATWGFCIADRDRQRLPPGEYKVHIDSELIDGSLTYGELFIPGESEWEVLLSTYICHPSMANNELSGPCVTTFLAKWILERKRRYSYRIVFVPETIGSLAFLSGKLNHLQRYTYAGFNVTCVGDERAFSYVPSRQGTTVSDRVAMHVLKHFDPNYRRYTWSDRGSDERQYCAPGIDLPIASMMRSKYGTYEEYHTSLDNLEQVVTPRGLSGSFRMFQCAIELLERNTYPKVSVLGEPQLGRRGLYPTLSTKNVKAEVALMMDVISWSDGTLSVLDIAEKCGCPAWDVYPIVEKLREHGVLALSSSGS